MRLQAVGVAQAVTACLLHNEPTSYHVRQGLAVQPRSLSESEPEEGVQVGWGRRETK